MKPILVLAASLLLLGARREFSPDPASETTVVARSSVFATEEIQDLTLPRDAGFPFSVRIWVEGEPLEAALEPVSLWAPDGRLLVQGPDGRIEEHEKLPTSTYRGTVVGFPGSDVRASLFAGKLTAMLSLPGRETHYVQPASDFVTGLPPGAHVVFRGSDVPPLPGLCGVTASSAPKALAPSRPLDLGSADLKGCAIAFDADVEFFESNGSSVGATEADILSVLNGVEAIFLRDTNISYEVTTILVRTAEPDPYSTTDPGALLVAFKDDWNTNRPGTPRDVAHLMTGRDLTGSVIGIAYAGSICDVTGLAYGLSESRFSTYLPGRIALSAHELGHGWNAPHCDADPDCAIMCSGLGGCSGQYDHFEAGSIAAITSFRNTLSCLSPGLVEVCPGCPYTTIGGGAAAVARYGCVLIDTGSFTEGPLTIGAAPYRGKWLKLDTIGGPVVIH